MDLLLNEETGKFEKVPDYKVEIYFDTAEIRDKWIEDQKRCVWHDLSKDPEDLPETEGDVLVCLHGVDRNITHQRSYELVYFIPDEGFYENKAKNDIVIAWKHIDSFLGGAQE